MTVRTPSVHRRAGLPAAVDIYEVGARDGLQNEARSVPTATKAEFIRRLVAAGLRTVEATSFVSPRWVPQLGDAEVLRHVGAAAREGRSPLQCRRCRTRRVALRRRLRLNPNGRRVRL